MSMQNICLNRSRSIGIIFSCEQDVVIGVCPTFRRRSKLSTEVHETGCVTW